MGMMMKLKPYDDIPVISICQKPDDRRSVWEGLYRAEYRGWREAIANRNRRTRLNATLSMHVNYYLCIR